MKKIKIIFYLILSSIGFLFMSCSQRPATAPDREFSQNISTRDMNLEERTIEEIAVQWPEDDKNLQLSGMDWYKNYLIILPECKNQLKNIDEFELSFYYIPKYKIIKNLNIRQNAEPAGSIHPLELKCSIKGFSRLYGLYNGSLKLEGFEAIAFHQEKNILFLTMEANIGEITMKGFLIKGEINPASLRIRVDLYKYPPVEIPSEVNIQNFTYETLLVTTDEVIAIYEANAENVNPHPKAYSYDHDLKNRVSISFPHIGYRITDATVINSQNRFWCTNYYYPGDRERLLLEDTGKNKKPVERLAEFRYDKSVSRIIPTSSFISLNPLSKNSKTSRNWEGIVRIQDKRLKKDGFLIVTDKYPRTILGFVSKGESSPPCD